VTVALTRDADGYLPIAAYGIVGDCRSAALVGVDGSVDWLCLPRFDDASVFGRILDAEKGGYWQISPVDLYRSHQRYRDLTNILDTVFTTDSGVLVVTDFMPVDEHDLRRRARFHEEPRLIRLVECVAGEVTVRQRFQPAPDFGRSEPQIAVHERDFLVTAGAMDLSLSTSVALAGVDAVFTLHTGEAAAFGLCTGRAGRVEHPRWSVEMARGFLRTSQQYWWRWIQQVSYDGPYRQPVWRSALVLKLLTYSPTGAILAAPTTSLPESIGGPRNWDYRYTWLRDASFMLYAFFQLGLTSEAEEFFHWLTHRHLAERNTRLPNIFDLSGRAHLEEHELTHLDGYRHSRPVRVGNGAAFQLQLDVYGELMDSAYVYARFNHDISGELWKELHGIVELAIARWQEPDSSIWEVRSEPQDFTYSKLMCWVAVDRGLRIAERFKHPHDSSRWKAARRAIHRRITAEGYSEELGAFTQVLGGDALDSSLLRMSQVRFLPDRDPRIISTIRAIERRLGEGPLVCRYRQEETDDGLESSEGAFFMTSFWLSDALAHAGDLEGAQRKFERLLTFASPVGLFSEEVDTHTGDLLGNYPQGFTHLALVGAAVNIERARHRKIGARGLHR
jgi:GH15 family glucan-1,4-alpha-glucosidase